MPNAHFDDRDGDWPRSFLAGPQPNEAGAAQARERRMEHAHSPQCSLDNASRHSRACMLHDSHRAERVGEFVPMTVKDEGKRSAGTVWISMRWALAYEYEVLRGCACKD